MLKGLGGLGGLGDMTKMMKAAQEMQGKMAELQESFERINVVGEGRCGTRHGDLHRKGRSQGARY